MNQAEKIKKELKHFIDIDKQTIFQSFFKTKKGEYGYGDKFLGISVPSCRKIAKNNIQINNLEITKLLKSKYHEERLTALIIMTLKFKKSKSAEERSELYQLYIENIESINNWDLVDVSAHLIIGAHLLKGKRTILYKLAKSDHLWSKRISIISTFAFIKQNDFSDTIKISRILLHDKHDLIHKAVGWMLREMGKKDESLLLKFLDEHYKSMPRTMLRYAIEKLPESQRQYYLKR